MDVEGLHMNIDYVGSIGIILSTKQKAALQSPWVWGKIFGVKSGYSIVQGVGKDVLKERKKN